jgi:DNA-binding response OmpR family regulator
MLVIDDEPAVCFALKKYFTVQGFDVDCARRVEEAVALLAETGCYSAVVADLRLGGINDMSGLEVIKRVHVRCPGTPIVVLTAWGSPEVETEVRCHGVGAFLHKPQPLLVVAQVVMALVGANP